MNFDTFQPTPVDTKKVSRLTAASGEMIKKTVTKSKFSQLNDKEFYFPDGVVSLLFYHPDLKDIDVFKQKKGHKIEKYFWDKKNLLKNGKKVLKNHPRLNFYH